MKKASKALALSSLTFAFAALGGEQAFIPADDARLSYSDYARLSFVESPEGGTAKAARFDRILEMPGKGYRWDNPGARLRFRTDAPELTVRLHYSDKHISTSARNPIGVYSIDGRREDSWTFKTLAAGTQRKPEGVDVSIKSPGPGAHDYEVILPYGDSVDVLGVAAPKDARFETPAPRPKTRCVVYGDSITHGFTASKVTGAYAFRLAEIKGWQLIDMGLGGRASTPSDAEVLASLSPDRLVVLMGANDWQSGVPVERYKGNMAQFIKSFKAARPGVPVYFMTPIWVHESWKPKGALKPLDDYRQALREAVAEAGDPSIQVVEGPELIDHEQSLFDSVAVHPNDAGFAMMAERLAKAVK